MVKTMMKLQRIDAEAARNINGGGKVYQCPFCNYTNSYWKTYTHALKHALKMSLPRLRVLGV